MSMLIPMVILIPVILCLPAWVIANKRHNTSPWSLLFCVPGIVLWVGLAMNGVGHQSIGNITEVILLALAAIPVFYIKVLFVDTIRPNTRLNTIIVAVMLCVAAVLLRLLMPVIPE